MQLEEYLFENNTIALQCHAVDWREAVRISTDLLEAAGAVTPEYFQGILKNRADNGPYFVILPSIAMPHAAPECGVNENGFSLVTLKTPVCFEHEEHDPVRIVFCIAAKDRKSLNEDIIVQIMNLLEFEETPERLHQATSLEDIRNLFREINR
ncbi:MAG: PTS sugar transporter subunit IIA [Planctomycetaceae bacterium]|nr:PTS sugar transporter subunit IIA [Planctomycetaceae bacterium]